MNETYEDLLLAATGRVATITLNRPEKLNAWTPAMGESLRRALLACAADDGVRAIIITGDLLTTGGDATAGAVSTTAGRGGDVNLQAANQLQLFGPVTADGGLHLEPVVPDDILERAARGELEITLEISGGSPPDDWAVDLDACATASATYDP